MKKILSGILVTLILISLAILAFKIPSVKSSGTIYIRADGSVEPQIANITSVDNVTYTFTGNNYDEIVVERDNIVVDGAGYSLEGIGSGAGISLSGRTNITIKNLEVTSFGSGIDLSGSSNNTVFGNHIMGSYYNIWLSYSEHNNFSGNNMTNGGFGIFLYESSHNAISENNIINNDPGDGIRLSSSGNNNISRNKITSNYDGIMLYQNSNDNNISGNNITENGNFGIEFWDSANNVLRNNALGGNEYNMGVYGNSPSYYFQDADLSNTVDDRLVCYWVSEQDMAVPFDAGYVALINCANITVQNLNLTNNGQGVILALTENSTIARNSMIENNWGGVWLWSSSNNSISENNITNNNGDGVRLDGSAGNMISKNNITNNNGDGFWLERSSYNTISGNIAADNSGFGIILNEYSSYNDISGDNITKNNRGVLLDWNSNDNNVSGNSVVRNNVYGIELRYSSNHNSISGNQITQNNEYGLILSSSSYNIISENNITNNMCGVYFYQPSDNVISGNNVTDNGCGVRFQYESTNNTICHNNFVNNTNQVDFFTSNNTWDNGLEGNYWSNYTGIDLNHDGVGDSWHEIGINNIDHYPLMGPFRSFNASIGKSINVISNSTVAGFEYESLRTIRFTVTNSTQNQTHGFCRVMIPHDVLSPPYDVTVNGADPAYWNYTMYDDGKNRWIYFEYEHTTREIVIVPEFPSLIILPLFMVVTLLVAIVHRKRFYPSLAPNL